MIRSGFLICLLCCSPAFFAQKKLIDHTAYSNWKKIEKQVISDDARWIAYETTPLKGDGFVCLYNVETAKTDTILRGKDPKFNALSNLLLVKITPGYDTLRSCELNKVDKTKWPKDSLYILELSTFQSVRIAKLKEYKVAEEGGRVAYLKEAEKVIPPKKPWYCPFQKQVKSPPKSNGGALVVLNNSLESEFERNQVSEFDFSLKGEYLSFITQVK